MTSEPFLRSTLLADPPRYRLTEAAAGAEGSGDAGGRFPADDEMRFGVPALMAALFPGVDAATIEILVMRAIGRFRQPA